MTDQHQPNRALRRLMSEYGFTREGLADEVSDTAEEIFGAPGRCSARLVAHWTSGKVTWPRERSRLPLEAIFGRPATELGFTPPVTDTARVTVRGTAQPPSQDSPVHRRKFLLNLTGTLLALPTLPEAGRLGMAEVERVRSVATRLHRLDDLHGGAELSKAAAHYIDHVEQAARRCTYGDRVQTGLYKALGEVATSAGWFAFDDGQQKAARHWWDTGLRYALLARDKRLQARIWSSMSHQACVLGHGGEAVDIARVALAETRGRRDGQLSSLLHTRVARGHAVQGQGGRCGRSMLRAEQEFERQPEEPQQWLRFFNTGEISGTAALCFIDLGQPAKAVDAARDALAVVQSTPLRRNELAAHVRLGRSLAAAGELDAALASGENALTLLHKVSSPRINEGLRRLRNDLLDRAPTGAADFSTRYEAMAACP
ncbi:hypothetical protein [Streptomyces sp. NBC_01506]|uniref:hypothetical protein n=1 Tax=Streptomyces sp. NBC_01506 TaxID=2903887 RepID=UPI00386701BA